LLGTAAAIAVAHAAADLAGKEFPAETRLCPTVTLVTTSTVSLPFSKPLVRSRETLIANLVASSMYLFLAARSEPAGKPVWRGPENYVG
jgi:hypothetical protein